MVKERLLILVFAAIASSSATAGLLKDGDHLVFCGDSITCHSWTRADGCHHLATNALERLGSVKNVTVTGLGFCGNTVGDWIGREVSVRDPNAKVNLSDRHGDRFQPQDVRKTLDGKVDVVAVLLGMNDMLRPSVAPTEKSLQDWACGYARLASNLWERTKARELVLGTITPLTADPYGPKNLIRKDMNRRIRQIAQAMGARIWESGEAAESVIDATRRCDPTFREAPDFVHPGDMGHLAIAAAFCRAVGEERAAAELDSRWKDRMYKRFPLKPSVSYRLRPRSLETPTADKLAYDLEWNVRGMKVPELTVEVPLGWTCEPAGARGSEGTIRITGTPDRWQNVVRLTAKDGAVVAATEVPVATPWCVSDAFDFPAAWDGMKWQTNAVPPVTLDAARWTRLLAGTWDYLGMCSSGSVDLFQTWFGGQVDSVYVRRRIISEKARTVGFAIGTEAFSSTLGFVVMLNGLEVWRGTLLRGQRTLNPPAVLPLVSGMNELVIRVDHKQWQRQFAFDLVPTAGDSLDDLRFDWRTDVAATDKCRYVNPFVGTARPGNLSPCAVWPMGMLQPGPDTGVGEWRYISGYQYSDKTLLGFSQSRLLGAGCADLLDARILPFTGEFHDEMIATMDKGSERAEPGYYSVRLADSGIKCEITVSPRTAHYRFTPPEDRVLRLYFDGEATDNSWWLSKKKIDYCADSSSSFDGQILSGHNRFRGWAGNRDVFYALAFSKHVGKAEKMKGLKSAKTCRWVLDFKLEPGEPLEVKVALSSVDEDGARGNLACDERGFSFEKRKRASHDIWAKMLSCIDAEGSESDLRVFYTALYHVFCQPYLHSDYDGRYRGADRNVSRTDGWNYYTSFSLWDTARAFHPLLTIIAPQFVPDFMKTFMANYKARGRLPHWTMFGLETNAMPGEHAIPVLVDAIAKNLDGGIDRALALKAAEDTLGRSPDAYRKCDYLEWERTGGSVSRTQEICLDDWCVSRLANILGRQETAAKYARRAGFWRNLYDPATGFFRGKDANGVWHSPFNPYVQGDGRKKDFDYIEGSAYHYLWMVQHDTPALIETLGGKERFVERLQAFFEAPEKMEGQGRTWGDCTGAYGQYIQGNEPCHHVAWMFTLAGRRDLTARYVAEICRKLYHDAPDGLCGNDDLGQMSAWYVFACLGFYPVNPCDSGYVLGAPLLPRMTINLADGKKFLVDAISRPLAETSSRTSISHEEIIRGGRLSVNREDMR